MVIDIPEHKVVPDRTHRHFPGLRRLDKNVTVILQEYQSPTWLCCRLPSMLGNFQPERAIDPSFQTVQGLDAHLLSITVPVLDALYLRDVDFGNNIRQIDYSLAAEVP